MDKYVLYGGPQRDNYEEGTKSLGEFLIKKLSEHGDKIALIDGVSSYEMTYRELLHKSLELAKALKSYGLKKNDVVSMCCDNRFEFPITFYATLYVGATLAPLNSSYTEYELKHSLNLSKPKIIFTSSSTVKLVSKIAKESKFLKSVVLFDNVPNFNMDGVILYSDFIKKFTKNPNEILKPEPVDLMNQTALILCSSGTTGYPKGVELTHYNLLSTAGMLSDKMKNIEETNNVILSILGVLPSYHSYGCLTLLGFSISGVKLIFLPKFDGKQFLGCIEKYKVNLALMVPPLMVFMAKHPSVDNYDLSSLRLLSSGAAPMGQELEDEIFARLKNKDLQIQQGYGLSETTISVTGQKDGIRKPGSVGSVSKGVWVKVADIETGKSLGPNKSGEILVKGACIMKGYINDEKANREIFDDDGWLHTGDVGYYDEDFQFFIVDRIKELIKYKGFQVPPAEIEALLLSHPKILDVAVIGKPDKDSGELPMGFVVKKSGVNLTEDEVKNFVKETLSGPKQLRGGVHFLDEIPKNPSGKILRRVLRDSISNIKSKL